jgi:hypothetical protein
MDNRPAGRHTRRMKCPTLGTSVAASSNPWKGALTLALALLAATASAQELRNAELVVRYDQDAGTLSLAQPGAPTPYFTSAPLGGSGPAVEVAYRHPTLGPARVLQVRTARGGQLDVAVYPDRPFAFVRPRFRNAGAAVTNLAQVSVLEGRRPAGGPALKAWGTAGLTAPDKHPGSYAFLALADPATRSGLVAAWLTHDRGSGIVFSGVDGDAVTLRAQLDYGRLLIEPGAEAAGETLVLGHFADVRLGLEQWADLVAKHYAIQLHPQLDGYCTWYSSPHGGAADEKSIVELSESAAKELKPFGFDFVQIDDYWQQGKRRKGPAKVFLEHNPQGPYPNGMKGPAEQIAALGLEPGLWFMPFAGDQEDPWFADKQDWFAKRADGSAYFCSWGGGALDQTHPAVQAYLSNLVHRIVHEWGYSYLKMDGMWMGTATKQTYVNNGYIANDDLGVPTVHDPKQTPIEAYRNGLKLIRQAAGRDTFILGCCVSQNMRSFAGTFGLVDAMRIGPDNGGNWNSIKVGPWHSANRYFLHGRVWYNDPDPCYIRASMPYEQAQSICSWVGLSGMLQASSDWLPASAPDRLNLLKRILPNHGRFARPVDILDREMANTWVIHDQRGGAPVHVVGQFNWDADQALAIEEPLARLELDPAKTYVGFDFWANTFVPPFTGALRGSLPGGACRILSLREAAARPVLVGTSRHITQGLVDVLDEQWNDKAGVLSGRSVVVAGDRYELRLVVPTGATSWTLKSAELGGAPAEVTQAGPQVRAAVTPAAGGEVAWKLIFTRGAVDGLRGSQPTALKAETGWRRIALSWTSEHALGYRIERDDGRVWQVAEPAFADTGVEPGRTHTYRVAAGSWDSTWSKTTEITATAPAQLKAPPVPPAPDVYLNDLKPVSHKAAWGSLQVNRSVENKPLTVAGKVYEHGIGTHAAASAVYAIPAGMKRFVAVAGLDDEKKDDPRASVIVKVIGDVKEMGEKPELLAESPVLSDTTLRYWHFDVPLNARHRELRLVFEDAGDGINCDHVDLVEAGFRRE